MSDGLGAVAGEVRANGMALQLADLFIKPGDHDAPRDYWDLADRIRQLGWANRFEYIILCGNVSESGQPDEFAFAKRILKTLAARVLEAAPESAREAVWRDEGLLVAEEADPNEDRWWRRRMIVVPGPHDRGNGSPPLAAFDDFYAKSFGEFDYEVFPPREVEGGPYHDLDRSVVHLTVRSTERFLAVGFFWDPSREEQEGVEEALWNRIQEVARNSSPRSRLLIVSSCIPPLMPSVEFEGNRQPLHLVGRTRRPFLESIRYHALQWGVPVAEEAPARLRRAHIHLLSGGQEGRRLQTIEFGPQLRSTRGSGQGSSGNEAPATSRYPFATARRELWKAMSPTEDPVPRRPLYFVRGVPGAGKTTFYNVIRRAQYEGFQLPSEINRRGAHCTPKCRIVAVDLLLDETVHDPPEQLARWEARVERAELALLREPRSDAKLILLVYNKSMRDPTENSGRRSRNVPNYLRERHPRLEVIYMARDETWLTGYLGLFEQRGDNELERPHFRTVYLSVVGEPDWRALLADHAETTGDFLDLRVLTGGLLGLSSRTLDASAARGCPDDDCFTRASQWRSYVEAGRDCRLVSETLEEYRAFQCLLMPQPPREAIEVLSLQLRDTPPSRDWIGPDGSIALSAEDLSSAAPQLQQGIAEQVWSEWAERMRTWGIACSASEDAARVSLGPLLPYVARP